jgi:gliding motility-associated-like protein
VLLWCLSANGLLGQKYNLLPDTVRYCQGDSAFISIVSHFGNKTTVSWETPIGRFANTRRVRPNKQGKYLVKVTSPQLAQPMRDSTFVRVYNKPHLKLRDTVLCKGQKLLLDARNPGSAYQWSTGETTQKIRVSNPGRYWIKITQGSCLYSDTILVKSPDGSLLSAGNETVFCLNDENKNLVVKTSPGTKILWSTGAVTPTLSITREGTYWVRTESPGCGPQVDTVKVKLKACECEMFIPNSFTPNEDGRNDYFFPVAQCEYSYYNLTISDRWGNTVFYTTNINGKWDGRFKGNLCPEDIYVYHIESTEKTGDKKTVRNGHISLFR